MNHSRRPLPIHSNPLPTIQLSRSQRRRKQHLQHRSLPNRRKIITIRIRRKIVRRQRPNRMTHTRSSRISLDKKSVSRVRYTTIRIIGVKLKYSITIASMMSRLLISSQIHLRRLIIKLKRTRLHRIAGHRTRNHLRRRTPRQR